MLTTTDYEGLAETLGTTIGYHDLVLMRRLNSHRISEQELKDMVETLTEYQAFMLGTICQYAHMDNARFNEAKFRSAVKSTVKAMHSGVVVTSENG